MRIAILLTLIVAFSGLTRGAMAEELSPSPVNLIVEPTEVALVGSRDYQQLLVSGLLPDQVATDLTRTASYESLNPQVAVVDQRGIVHARGDGSAEIAVDHDGQRVKITVTVSGGDRPRPRDFRTDVIAALSKGGCNQGACHGSPQGKNGFRLSLRGFDPTLDIQTLTREFYGRRINLSQADASLVLLKATAKVAHEGGRRFHSGDAGLQVLRDWIHEGGRDSEIAPSLSRLEVLPKHRQLASTSNSQQIVVRAHFSDGSVRDVTDLTVFSSSNEEQAPVDPLGLVNFQQTAETAILARYRSNVSSARLSYVRSDPGFASTAPAEVNDVDRHTFEKHRTLQLHTAAIASDAVFLRRVYLDLLGVLPQPDEARAFLDSTDERKRSQLIDALLERQEFAGFWAMKWADLMRGSRDVISERGTHKLHRHLVRMFAEDKPFSDFARDSLTGLGNTIDVPAANFFRISRTPDAAAESMSQLFLGVRIQCAKCHNHPFEAITQDNYYEFAAYFAKVKLKGIRFGRDETIVYLGNSGAVKHPGTGKTVIPAAFGTRAPDSAIQSDPRTHLADWLTDPANPYFARSTVNRIWKHLLGKGLFEPVDDLRTTNPAANEELLQSLSDDFVDGGYRFKPIIRKVLNSNTYQLSSKPPERTSPHAADAKRYFTRAHVRMLAAEQIIDAISSATGISEPFPGYPVGTRAMELAEGEVDHDFLKAFDKPVRDTACECARNSDLSLNQVLHLLNNPGILRKLDNENNRFRQAIASGGDNAAVIESMYLATLSRRPTQREMELAREHVEASDDRGGRLSDIQYALINSNEFLFRH